MAKISKKLITRLGLCLQLKRYLEGPHYHIGTSFAHKIAAIGATFAHSLGRLVDGRKFYKTRQHMKMIITLLLSPILYA